MKFNDYPFSAEILKNLENLGFKKPTDIQFKSISPILAGEDLFAVAQTGTGKTAAFAIPLIDKINRTKKNSKSSFVCALVLVPTRELANQIAKVFNSISSHTKVSATAIIGGKEIENQAASLSGGVDVVVATPGRVFDLVNQKLLKLDFIKYLVLDEADRMLGSAFIKDIEYVKKLIKGDHQTLFFSATLTPEIKKLAFSVIKGNAIHIQISPKDPISKNVHHRVAFIEQDHKRFFLLNFILEHPGERIILFVRTKVRATRVGNTLAKEGISCGVIFGELDQKQREEVLSDFRSGNTTILIATDLTARGIDINGVNFVINYDLPDDPQYYVHRIGRTGRAFNRGVAISFCSSEEREKLFAIEAYIGKTVEPLSLSQKSYAFALQSEGTPFSWAKVLEEELIFLEKKEKKLAKSKSKSSNAKSKSKSAKAKVKSSKTQNRAKAATTQTKTAVNKTIKSNSKSGIKTSSKSTKGKNKK